MTPLDDAQAAMDAAPDSDAARLDFFARFLDTELFLLLEAEAQGDTVTPRTVETQDQTLVIVFDREVRLAEFAGEVAPHATLSGRALVQMLSAENLGFALNPDVAPSSFVLDADGVAWLAETFAQGPVAAEETLASIHRPSGLPERLIQAIDQKLAAAQGLAQAAFLVRSETQDGGQGHLLAFLGALPGAEDVLARAVSEALVFSGLDAAALDVAFFDGDHAIVPRLASVGLRFDLPQPQAPDAPSAPGRDPAKPPKLR